MEKNTKILLGVGAVIAAYLILKPKKAAAQTSVVASKLDGIELKKVLEELKKQQLETRYTYGCGGGGCREDYIPKRPYMPPPFDPYCVCAKSPCNCGDGGVKLDTLIQNQSYEY
jgi:hypothetical protein